MTKSLPILLSFFLFTSFFGSKKWTPLLDRNLSQWDVYLSYPHKSQDIKGLPRDADGNYTEPIGLNKDKWGVFTVKEENDEMILHVSGEIYGAVSTKQEFENYHLKLQVKWGEKTFAPRKTEPMNSGLHYNAVGPHGADYWRTWMKGQECQIMQGRFGDYWSQAGGMVDVRAVKQADGTYLYTKNAPLVAFGGSEKAGGYVARSQDFEKPKGEWNTVELINFEGKSLHIINGQVVMVLENSRHIVDGKEVPLRKGKLELQCEGAELFFKDIEIRQLKKLPGKYKQFF
ncbi:MAG: DUF1080 domain-containing protein [Saprospiraceae bacterium]|nr:DUF1080 domain-containing protein [Saprospiraceae bacterium]